ncbi:hypothetical protein [Janibacter melonis]|uniref:hypothetical protein n=1 Tax=Janibacter melonis TaxID=262209 RepID=UPI001917D180
MLSRDQLRSLGIERGVTARLVHDRRWAAWGRHSVVTHCADVELVGACWRAVHEVGGGALVDGVSALRAAGVSGLDGSVVHVSVHSLQRSPTVDGVAVHKVSRRVEGEAAGAGLPRTRPAIAALRAAQWAVSDRQAALYLAVPVQQRLVTGAQLEAALEQYRAGGVGPSWRRSSPTSSTERTRSGSSTSPRCAADVVCPSPRGRSS